MSDKRELQKRISRLDYKIESTRLALAGMEHERKKLALEYMVMPDE